MSENIDDSYINPIPVESADDMVLRMFKGATFAPGASLILPSGKKLDGYEAQAFTAAFSDDSLDAHAKLNDNASCKPVTASPEEVRYEDDPLSSRFDQWTGDPKIDRALLVIRAMHANNRPVPKKAIDTAKSIEQDKPSAVEATVDVTSRKTSVIRKFFKRMTE